MTRRLNDLMRDLENEKQLREKIERMNDDLTLELKQYVGRKNVNVLAKELEADREELAKMTEDMKKTKRRKGQRVRTKIRSVAALRKRTRRRSNVQEMETNRGNQRREIRRVTRHCANAKGRFRRAVRRFPRREDVPRSSDSFVGERAYSARSRTNHAQLVLRRRET